MQMCCNMQEAHRIREEIILKMAETQTLTRIYLEQCTNADKKNVKVYTPDCITFETGAILRDFVNQIDLNEGMNLDFDIRMPFMEYDPNLAAILDFKSTSCIKHMLTDLGVEELRAILHT